jgi:hypothetical protein
MELISVMALRLAKKFLWPEIETYVCPYDLRTHLRILFLTLVRGVKINPRYHIKILRQNF